ncbi:MAG: Wzy polymerase domain-containing protein [Burkholderiales bacterium]|nr:Wzy polymerase domain-containing protein [Burkholderiales bacterium]
MLTVAKPGRPARASLFVVGLMWALPFLQSRHFLPLPMFYSEWLAFVLGLGALFLLPLPRPARELELPWVSFVPLALFGILLVHLALIKAAYPQQVLLASLYLLWAAALIILGSLLRRETGLAGMSVTLAWFVLAGGVLNALAGILQHYEMRGFLEPVIATKVFNAVYGNLAQPNHFADHISLALASLLFLCARGKVPLVVAGLLSCLLLYVLSLTGSRSAWLYLVAMAVLATLLYRKDNNTGHRRLLIFSLLLLPGFVLAQGLAHSPWLSAPTPLTTSTERLIELASGASDRLQLWREAWLMFLQSPLLGVGYGQFAWQHFLLAGTIEGASLTGHTNHAHNIFLQFLAETGLPGAVTLLAGITIWLWGLRRLELSLESWWVLAMLAVLGIHSMLEYPLWHAYFLGIASILLGAGETRFLRVRLQKTARAGFAILMVVGWVSALSLLHNYYVLETALFPRSPKATRMELDRTRRELMSVHGSLLTPYVELAFARALDLDSHNLDQKIEFSSRVMRFAPTAVIVYQHAALLALKGDHAQAMQYLERAVFIDSDKLDRFSAELARLGDRDKAALGAFRDRVQKYRESRQLMVPSGAKSR